MTQTPGALVSGYIHTRLRGDLFGGITAAVVALPLALAFGVASGMGPVAGLWGAIVVGFFAAVFGGTRTQVSGPTGPMTVVMAATVMQFSHNATLIFTAVMLAGVMQILFGRLRIGRYVTYIPFPVISGFMTGVGCVILILQLAPLAGHPTPEHGVYQALVELPGVLMSPRIDPLMVGAVSLATVIFWPRLLRRWVPAPLAALVIGTLTARLFFPQVPVIGPIPHGLPSLQWPTLELGYIPDVIRAAFTLAVLGTIDSLLTSLVADSVTRTRHRSDRELTGQGIGNLLAGLLGALPGAGATMRTMVNIRAGGRTRVSGAVHALVLMALALGFSGLVEQIPLAALAAILMKVGWEIIDWPFLRLIGRADRADIGVALLVTILTVSVDLIMAVGIGIIVANMISARNLSSEQLARLKMVSSDTDLLPLSDTERRLIREADGRIMLLHLSGPFSFCSAKDMVRRLDGVGGSRYRAVVFDLTDVTMIDVSVAMSLKEMIDRFFDADIPVFLAGQGQGVIRRLAAMAVLEGIPEHHLFATRQQAIERAAASVTQKP